MFAGNTKGGSITVPFTSYLTGLNLSVLEIKTKIVSSQTADSKRVKPEVNGTVILPPLVFPVANVIKHFTASITLQSALLSLNHREIRRQWHNYGRKKLIILAAGECNCYIWNKPGNSTYWGEPQSREVLVKWKVQYSRPPCTKWFWPPPLYFDYIIYIFQNKLP